MATSSNKELILSRVRRALAVPTELPFPRQETEAPIFPQPGDDDLSVLFASEFTRLLGLFAYCENESEMVRQVSELLAAREWRKPHCPDHRLKGVFASHGHPVFPEDSDVVDCDVSVTCCEALVARTGGIVLSSAQREGRTSSVYAPVHVCIAYTSQLVHDIGDAIARLQAKYGENLPSLLSFATGPSRTADIEKTLVVGVHGPKEVFCFLVED